MLAVVVLAEACLAKSSQTCAQMTDVQQPAASPSQTGQGMSLQDVELYLLSLIPIGSCAYWIGQNFVASASVST
jgi:hypothetical protein